MAEYIEREAILKEIAEIGGHLYSDWETAGVINLVCRQPAADVAPVVRCKDCKWFAECVGKDSGKPCGYGQCTRPLCMRSLIGTGDFCSYGERRSNER